MQKTRWRVEIAIAAVMWMAGGSPAVSVEMSRPIPHLLPSFVVLSSAAGASEARLFAAIERPLITLPVGERQRLERLANTGPRHQAEPVTRLSDAGNADGSSEGRIAADPYFPMWQQRAKAKLSEERGLDEGKPHPLAERSPDKFLVICEAGCKSGPDSIVNVMPKPPLAERGELEVTAADGAEAVSEPARRRDAQLIAAKTQDPNTINCIAGCFDSPRITRAREPSAFFGKIQLDRPRADMDDGARSVRLARIKRQKSVNGAIITLGHWPERIQVRSAASERINSRLAQLREALLAADDSINQKPKRIRFTSVSRIIARLNRQ